MPSTKGQLPPRIKRKKNPFSLKRTPSQKNFHTQSFSGLAVCSLNKEQHEKTCGYWYCVSTKGMALTAFNKREHFLQWLEDRNLTLESELAEHGTNGYVRINGTFLKTAWTKKTQFNRIKALKKFPMLNNGRYTVGKITENAEGVRMIHYMNINYNPVELDYKQSKEMVG